MADITIFSLKGGMLNFQGGFIFGFLMAHKAGQLIIDSAQEEFLVRSVRVVAGGAGSLADRRMDRAAGEFFFDLRVTGITELRPFLLQHQSLGKAMPVVARFAVLLGHRGMDELLLISLLQVSVAVIAVFAC